MRKIWKYLAPLVDTFDVMMPIGSIPLTVQVQRDEVFIWALVNPENPEVYHNFCCAGTGNPISEEVTNVFDYIGTVQIPVGLVLHYFYMGEANI